MLRHSVIAIFSAALRYLQYPTHLMTEQTLASPKFSFYLNVVFRRVFAYFLFISIVFPSFGSILHLLRTFLP